MTGRFDDFDPEDRATQDAARRRWQDRRQRRDDRPGEVVAYADPDGDTQQLLAPQAGNAATVTIRNRDTATFALTEGCTLIAMQPGPYGAGYLFVFDGTGGTAYQCVRRWRGDGDRFVDARRYAAASAILRQLVRTDGAALTAPVTMSAEEGTPEHDHQRRTA